MLDLCAFGLLIGQAVGRWGNFVNREVYGRATKLPWRMTVYGADVHPLFLYESLWCVLGFFLLRRLMDKRKYNGQIFLLYLAWYGLGRGFFEGMRDTRYSLMVGSVPVMLVIAVASCLVAVTILCIALTSLKRENEDVLAWTAGRDAYAAQRKRDVAPSFASGNARSDVSGKAEGFFEDDTPEPGGGDKTEDGTSAGDSDFFEKDDDTPESTEDA